MLSKIRDALSSIVRNPTGQTLALSQLWILALVKIAAGQFPAIATPLLKYEFFQNLPAIMLDRLLMGEFLIGIITLPLIYLQWILIGWVANVTAIKIQAGRFKLP